MERGTIRLMQEEEERRRLRPGAALAAETLGRAYPDAECDLRTAFQRDRDRIIHCKAFRRLKHKTQVFIAPEGDHYRTRLTHTLEVAQIARTAARALRLNEDLTEAIALGHDLGHTPFGHSGEEALNRVVPGGFCHNEQSRRVVEVLERRSERYPGLNLTWEVRDGILNHTGPNQPATLEGQIVRFADRIAYLNHDVDDAVRAGVLRPEDLPAEVLQVLGKTGASRIDLMVRDLVATSWDEPAVRMSSEVWEAMNELRTFLFSHVYIGSEAKRDEGKAQALLVALYQHYVACPSDLGVGGDAEGGESAEVTRRAADYVAGMTDRFALAEYERLFLPAGWGRY
ncbi:MAG: deoxyguanosinetriphosphate triphosphohydrolase [Bacillota bacterium]|nr:deoxyguanosinetriphosphate triphosphohydrolase [Bacillota bacterium]